MNKRSEENHDSLFVEMHLVNLSWLHRDQFSLKLKRGDLISVDNVDVRANELRVILAENIKKF